MNRVDTIETSSYQSTGVTLDQVSILLIAPAAGMQLVTYSTYTLRISYIQYTHDFILLSIIYEL